MEYYTKTKSLLKELHESTDFQHESWSDVPEELKKDIRDEFYFEMPESELAEHYMNRLTAESCAKFMNSGSDADLIKFAKERVDALIDKSHDSISELFHETRPTPSEQKEHFREQKSFANYDFEDSLESFWTGVSSHA